MPIQNRLREERMLRQWTQEEVAARIGCARGTLNAIENHRRDPSPEVMLCAAKAFGKPVEALFEVVSEKQLQKYLRLAKNGARALLRTTASYVLALLVLANALVGYAAAQPPSNFAAQFAALLGDTILHPGQAYAARQALSIDPRTATECTQWINRFGASIEQTTDRGLYQRGLLEQRAECLDRIGDSEWAYRDRRRLAQLEAFEVFNPHRLAVAKTYGGVEGLLLLFQSIDALRLGDRRAARRLVREGVALNSRVPGVIRRWAGCTQQAPPCLRAKELARLAEL